MVSRPPSLIAKPFLPQKVPQMKSTMSSTLSEKLKSALEANIQEHNAADLLKGYTDMKEKK